MAKISQTKDIHNNGVPKHGTIVPGAENSSSAELRKPSLGITTVKITEDEKKGQKAPSDSPFNEFGLNPSVRVPNCDYFDVMLGPNCPGGVRFVELLAEGLPELEMGGVRLVKFGNGTNRYKYGYKVYLDGERLLFAQLFTTPRSGNVKNQSSDSSSIKVENFQLYRKGWTRRFDSVLSAFGFHVTSWTRIDIAIDGVGYLDSLYNVHNGFWQLLDKRTKFRPDALVVDSCGGHRSDSYTIGSFKSDKHLRVYSKGLTIEKQNKHYIAKSWVANGLIQGESCKYPVERAEFRMFSGYFRKMVDTQTGELAPGVDVLRLEEPAYMVSLVRAGFEKYCNFISRNELDKKGNVSRCERIPLIDWSELESMDYVQYKNTSPPGDAFRAKQTVKELERWHDDNTMVAVAGVFNFALRRAGYEGATIEPRHFKYVPEGLISMVAKMYGVEAWTEKRMGYKDRTFEAVRFQLDRIPSLDREELSIPLMEKMSEQAKIAGL